MMGVKMLLIAGIATLLLIYSINPLFLVYVIILAIGLRFMGWVISGR
jgi:hypothetical protein